MKTIEVGKEYLFTYIESKMEDDFITVEHGQFIIGENFLAVKDGDNVSTCSFVLTGQNHRGSIYKCIYNGFS